MRTLYFLSVLLLMPVVSSGQDEINALKAPNSPAAAILGIQPSTVLVPKSLRALEAAVISNFGQNTDQILPDDFGLEFTPYWFKDHGLGLREYLDPKPGPQLWRNLSVSIASSRSFLLQDSTQTNSLAFGLRTSVFFGSAKDYETIEQNLKMLSNVQDVRIAVLQKFVELDIANTNSKDTYIDAAHPVLILKITDETEGVSQANARAIADRISLAARQIEYDDSNRNAFFEAYANLLFNELGDQYQNFKKYITEREGPAIDIAYASFLNFPTNNFEYSTIPRQSVWLTPSYSFNSLGGNFKAIGVLRWEWYNEDYFVRYFPLTDIYRNNFDYGLAAEGTFGKFSGRIEGVGRSQSTENMVGEDENGNSLYTKKSNSDLQYIATLSYRITPAIVLSYQFGSAFDPVFSTNGSLISILSLNFGFGGPNGE